MRRKEMDRSKAEQPKSGHSEIAKGYLILYNFLMFIGWSGIFFVALLHILTYDTYLGIWNSLALPVYVFQTGAILEVVHAAVGLVRSNPFLTLFQVTSRLVVVWLVLYSAPTSQTSLGVPLVLGAWSVTEIIRYLFYAYGLVGHVPAFLVWCRYTLFIVLYPIGVTGELMVTIAALPQVRKTGMYSVRMPNKVNFAFDFYYAMIIFMLLYIPIFPQLYLHMFAQRRKILGKKKAE